MCGAYANPKWNGTGIYGSVDAQGSEGGLPVALITSSQSRKCGKQPAILPLLRQEHPRMFWALQEVWVNASHTSCLMLKKAVIGATVRALFFTLKNIYIRKIGSNNVD